MGDNRCVFSEGMPVYSPPHDKEHLTIRLKETFLKMALKKLLPGGQGAEEATIVRGSCRTGRLRLESRKTVPWKWRHRGELQTAFCRSRDGGQCWAS